VTGVSPLVSVDGLTITAAGRPVIDGVSLTLPPGGSLGLVGTSGSGKTTTALALLGHVRDGMTRAAGTVRVQGVSVLPHPPPWLRGSTVGYLPQDPGQSLNPYQRIGAALLTAIGRRIPRPSRAVVVAELLEQAGLPGDPAFVKRFPHQLSGGQQQRVALAIALSRSPALLILDEPTTGLDAITKAGVLAELARIHAGGVAMLWVSHDLAMLSGTVSRVLVLDRGRVAEDAATEQVLSRPSSDAAIRLVQAMLRPVPGDSPGRPAPEPVMTASGLVASHGRGTDVLNGVDITARRGECLVVLGASGVGKTTLARCLAGLHIPARGTVLADGECLHPDVRRRTREQRALVQLVAQDPADALHPCQTVHTAIARPLRVLRGIRAGETLDEKVNELLAAVHLDPGYAGRLPGELSGGERQRVALARALAAGPRVLLCDEITSALDLVTQAAVLDLLRELRRSLGLAVVLITHDLDVAASTADRLAILVDGRVAEEGPTGEVLNRPASAIGRRLRQVLAAAAAATPAGREPLYQGWGNAGVSPRGTRHTRKGV
jgi:peptide/nickel transport system ATP-binding protein